MPTPQLQIIEPELTYINGQFLPNRQIGIGPDGNIIFIRPASPPEHPLEHPLERESLLVPPPAPLERESFLVPPPAPLERESFLVPSPAGILSGESPAAAPILRLPNRALLPGFVNVHSHAFQRGLRGLAEYFPADSGDFWSWREEMYRLVERLDGPEFKALCRLAFDEMLSAGITTVGEFHYFHHDKSGRGHAFDNLVLEAAAEAGIRIVLLQSYYEQGGIGKPSNAAQRRFGGGGLIDYVRQLRALESTSSSKYMGLLEYDQVLSHLGTSLLADEPSRGAAEPPEGSAAARTLATGQHGINAGKQTIVAGKDIGAGRHTIGIAPHSVRAAPIDDIRKLRSFARERGFPFHMHVEEQRGEIEEFLAAHNQWPLEWLLDNNIVDANFTAVHCTQSKPDAVRRLLDAGGHVCACPITEGNLGDGIGHADLILQHRPDALCIGTDSNIRIDMCEELRWLEFAQRLKHQKRGVCKGPTNPGRSDAAASRESSDDSRKRADEARAGAGGDVAQTLFACATINGATALGLRTGSIEPGRPADFFTIDLNHPTIRGATPETLLAAFIFGSGADAVREVCVGGRWVK